MGRGARTSLLGLLLAAGLAAGAFWWLATPDATVATEESAGPGADAAAEDSAALAARGTARPPDAVRDARGRGTVQGLVRRMGQPATARVLAYDMEDDTGKGRGSSIVPLADGAAPTPVAEAQAGADGTFRLDLASPGTYLLVARGDGTGRAEVTLRASGVRAGATIELRGGKETLEGRARHADGRPFRGSVVVEPVGQAGPTSFVLDAVTTDDEGRFQATGLEAGIHTVAAFLPGRWRAQGRTITIPHTGEYVLVVDEGTREVVGRVLDDKDGRGVAGAVVTTNTWSAGDLERFDGRAVTDGDGRFTARAGSPRASWMIDAAGFTPLSQWRLTPPEGTAIEFRLLRLARLSGRVTSEGDGAPVAGVTVYAADGSGNAGPKGTTDADGRYAIAGVRPGDVTVFAWGNGWCSADLESAQSNGFNPLATTVAPDAAVVVDLVVRRAARASGRVTNAADAAVAGAQVTSTRFSPAGSVSTFFSMLAGDTAVATDAEGRFAVTTLLPGVSYRFEATAPDTSPAQSPPLRADAATPLVVDLKLGAPRWADVDVVEKESGAPVAGVQIQAHQQVTDGNWRSFGPAISAGGGRARLGPLPPGPFMLWAWAEGYECTEQPTVGGPEGSTSDVQGKLVLVRTRFVQGVIRYADGQPASGVVIRVKGTDFESTEEVEEGRFRVQVPSTETSVEVAALKGWEGDVLTEARATPGGPSVTLTVPGTRPSRLAVRIVDAAGRAVPAAQAVLATEDNSDWEGVVDGRAEFPQPKAAAHVLVFGARGPGGPLPAGLTIAGPIEPTATEFEVALGPELRIEGVVRTADGRPVRGVYLRVRAKGLPPPFANWNGEIATTRTDDAGRFRIGGLGAGTYEIRVDAADRGGRTEPVEAKAGTTDLVITLGEGAEAVLTVVGPDRQPVAGALVRARTQGTRWTSTETDPAGVARLRGLDRAAKYRLEVTPNETRQDLLSFVKEGWSPSDDLVELPPAFAIQGTVRDTSGAPVVDGWVDAILRTDVVQRARVTNDGTFRFQRLAAGTYRLVARTQDGSRASRPQNAAAGARDVALLLDAARTLAVRIEGWVTPEGGQWAALWDEETGAATDWVEIASDGVFRVGGLHPDLLYTVYVVREEPGDERGPGPARVAWKKGVRGDAGEVTVPLEPGVTIGVRVLLPPGVQGASVWATDGTVRRDAWMGEPTRGRFTGLHPGTWTVKAEAGAYAAEARVEAGGSVELDLKPVR